MEKENTISEELAVKIVLDSPKRLFKNVTNKTPAPGSAKAARPKIRERIRKEPVNEEIPSDTDSAENEASSGESELAEPEKLTEPEKPEEPIKQEESEKLTEPEKLEEPVGPIKAEKPEPAEQEESSEPEVPKEPTLKSHSGNCWFKLNKQHETNEEIWADCLEIPEDIIDRWVYAPLPEYIPKPKEPEELILEPLKEFSPALNLNSNPSSQESPQIPDPEGSFKSLPDIEEEEDLGGNFANFIYYFYKFYSWMGKFGWAWKGKK